MLWLDGCWLIDETYIDRRHVLERLSELSDGDVPILSSFSAGDVDELLAACDELDLEGVVMKRDGSRYRPGHSRDWRKVKTTSWRSVHLPARQRALTTPR